MRREKLEEVLASLIYHGRGHFKRSRDPVVIRKSADYIEGLFADSSVGTASCADEFRNQVPRVFDIENDRKRRGDNKQH